MEVGSWVGHGLVLARFESCVLLAFCDSLQEREKHFGTFFVHVCLTVLKLASLEKKKKMIIFEFFSKFVFSASIQLS